MRRKTAGPIQMIYADTSFLFSLYAEDDNSPQADHIYLKSFFSGTVTGLSPEVISMRPFVLRKMERPPIRG